METRSRNIVVTGQNSLETNGSKLAQAAVLLSALQEKSEQEYRFCFPTSSSPRKLKRSTKPTASSFRTLCP